MRSNASSVSTSLEGGAHRGERQRVAGERAADAPDVDQVGVVASTWLRRRPRRRTCRRHRWGCRRRWTCRSRRCRARGPSAWWRRPDRPRRCASRRSSAACRTRVASSRSPSRKPGSGRTMPMLVSAGSVRIAATSPCASCGFDVGEVVELGDPGGLRSGDRWPDVARAGPPPRRRGPARRRSRRRCRGSSTRTSGSSAGRSPAGPAGSPSGWRRSRSGVNDHSGSPKRAAARRPPTRRPRSAASW